MSVVDPKKFANISPAAYAAAAVLANAVGEEMLRRLEWVTLKPQVVLDVGCGTGHCAALLRACYPQANVLAQDVAYPMLEFASQQVLDASLICADAMVLPFKDNSVDLLFANLVLPWCDDVKKTLHEWRRVLRPEGLLMFSSLGPDTLQQWQEIFAGEIIPDLVDVHDVGDALTRGKFSDPVLDVDYFTFGYRDVDVLLRELQATGMLAAFEKNFVDAAVEKTGNGLYPVTYEIVYGHAWCPDAAVEHVADEFGTVNFPLAHLRRRGL
jgi:malonyl-CoA O-methyltransferase